MPSKLIQRTIRLLTIISVCCGLSACQQQSQPKSTQTITHDAYIWQHQWTPALKSALITATPWINSWHVLGAELKQQGQLTVINIDFAALAQSQKPLTLVIRIDGQLSNWTPETVINTSLDTLNHWRNAGLLVNGLEIDYDCPTSKLNDYTNFLSQLQQRLEGQSVKLLITTLPTWLTSKSSLSHLLSQVDEAVLQVHSVSNPQQGLFAPQLAAAWIKEFSLISPVPFKVALANYGSRIAWDKDGQILAVESEESKGLISQHTHELSIAPATVAELLDNWRLQPPINMNGVIWFRLPTSDDKRAWSLSTWKAVINGEPLTSHISAKAVSIDNKGLYNIILSNDGEIDSQAPQHIDVISHQACIAADALNQYQMQRSKQLIQYFLLQPSNLRAHHQSLIGWVRCPTEEIEIHVH